MALRRSSIRVLLFAGVSTVALTVGAAELRAADVAPAPRAVLKAPPAVLPPSLTIWIEGAAIFTGGSNMNALNPLGPNVFEGKSFDGKNVLAGPDFVSQRPKVGWEGAFGADYRLPGLPGWHVSFDVRYGKSKANRQDFSSSNSDCFEGIGSICYVGFSASSQARFTENEDHLVADFMVGRDFALGLIGLNQIKFGVRVADLRARQNVQAQHTFNAFSDGDSFFTSAIAVNINTKSEFLGVGPRIAAEGFIPLGGPWGVDWAGGLAVLFGKQKYDADTNGLSAEANGSGNGSGEATTFSSNVCATGGLLNCSSNKAVFNADVNAALSYAFTPRAKLSAGIRFDGYWSALRTLNADFSGGLHNENRFYWGPFLRLTGAF